jgi:hypothetical protein
MKAAVYVQLKVLFHLSPGNLLNMIRFKAVRREEKQKWYL